MRPKVAIDVEPERHPGDQGDGLEVVEAVAEIPEEVRIGGERRRARHVERVAIRRGMCDLLGRRNAGGAADVLDHDVSPVDSLILPISRAMISVVPPAAKPTTIVTVRLDNYPARTLAKPTPLACPL